MRVIEKEWVCVVNFDTLFFSKKVSKIILLFYSYVERFVFDKASIWTKNITIRSYLMRQYWHLDILFFVKKIRLILRVFEKEWVCVVNFDTLFLSKKVSKTLLLFYSYLGRFVLHKAPTLCQKSKTNFESYREGVGMCSEFWHPLFEQKSI